MKHRQVTETVDKIFVNEQDLILDSFRLGRQIHDSGFYPDYLVGIWRGGSAVGIVVQECLQYLGVKTDHIPIRTSYRGMENYAGMIRNTDQIRVHGLEYLVSRLDSEHRLLLVDDVFSSGHSVQAVKEKLQRQLRQNMPEDIRVATVWYRPVSGRTGPEYFLHETDRWLVLPYELSGLTLKEIHMHKHGVAPILESIRMPKS